MAGLCACSYSTVPTPAPPIISEVLAYMAFAGHMAQETFQGMTAFQASGRHASGEASGAAGTVLALGDAGGAEARVAEA